MKKTPKQLILEILNELQAEIQAKLIANQSIQGNWVARPTKTGWWLWREGGDTWQVKLMLISDNGAHVADDDEWEQATGTAPNYDLGENYWEGTETTQAMMPGTWYEITFPALLRVAAKKHLSFKENALLLESVCEEIERLGNELAKHGMCSTSLPETSPSRKMTTVCCKFCNKQVPEATAHTHDGGWVGDECCWDERLRCSE